MKFLPTLNNEPSTMPGERDRDILQRPESEATPGRMPVPTSLPHLVAMRQLVIRRRLRQPQEQVDTATLLRVRLRRPKRRRETTQKRSEMPGMLLRI